MNSKERVLTTLARQQPDRVPINYNANPGIDARVKAHFGLAADDAEGLRRRLGVDFRRVDAPYVGPNLHGELPDRQIDPVWGKRTRWIEHESGGYWDYCDFPLRDADEDAIAAWPKPSADDYDYTSVAFVGDEVLVGYSKVDLADVPPGGSSNHYSWVQQRRPLEWLYAGDCEVVFGG